MSDSLAPLLIIALLLTIGWALRRRPQPVPGHSRAVLDGLEDAVLVYDEDGQLVHLNQTARNWFGLDETEHYETQSLHTRISPPDEFTALLAHDGRASLKVGSRWVEAVSRRTEVQGFSEVTMVLHDVTAYQMLLAKERQRANASAVFSEIDQAIHTSSRPDELLDNILNKLQHLFPGTSAAISLWDPQSKQLVEERRAGPMAESEGALSQGKGYAFTIVRERKPLLLEDTSQQSVSEGDLSILSYVGVPLSTAEFVGTLELFSGQAGAFSTETVDTLGIVARHVAVAVENARLYRETLVRAEEMATLNTLSAAINTSLDPDELLEIIVHFTHQATECDRLAVFLMDNERRVLSLAKSRGLSEHFVRQNQNIKPQLEGQGQVVLDRYPLAVGDIRRAETLAPIVSLLQQEGISAFADLPLRGREHVLGALTVYYNQPHTFDRSEMELLQTIANQATLALENTRLYEGTDRALARRVDQLAAIEEIGRELTSTLDMTRVFNLVLQRAMGSTGASAGLLALCDANCSELELIADRGYPPGTLERYRTEGWPTTYGIAGRVARTGETALVNDVYADPHYVPHLPDTCAQLTVPVVKEARVLGVVSLESSRSQGFSPDDVRFTTQLAELAAIAIDNARLFQQVREGRDNLQAILDSIREAILVIGRDQRIVLANPMIEELSGLSAQVLVGRRVARLVAELGPRVLRLLGCAASEMEEVSRLLDATSDQLTKRTYEMPGSPPRHIEQVASPVMDKDGAVAGRLVVFRDVTEERHLTLVRQDLTDMIIHDLRSPLTAVVGGVQVANDLTEASADPAAIMHALDLADQSCNRLMSLVDSLLDISRLEAGQMPLERHPVMLPQLAQSVIRQMTPLAERETVTLRLQTASPILPVDADEELIGRVLVNLVDNALKHSPSNSTVTIKITPELADWKQGLTDPDAVYADAANSPSAAVRCAVLDTGPGIPSEYRTRVFERFSQLDGRRTGKGLGLAFCQLAVQAHGGRIWVEDNPLGQGSAFSFALPVVPPELLSPADPDWTDDQVGGSDRLSLR